MVEAAAKEDDLVIGLDTHIVMVPSGSGTAPTPQQLPFKGVIDGGLSQNVKIMGKPAAMRNSTATNKPGHQFLPPGVSFQRPPSDSATIQTGSSTVFINGKPAARNGDDALTCDDVNPSPHGKVQAYGSVRIG